jgi:ABC-2 type transport system ATP-binding protein
MKQRLGIARAVIHRPKVLLLDEPASGLDPKSRIDLKNLLNELQRGGATILISSHILPDLEGFCTSIGIMEKGEMLRSGRIEGLAGQHLPAKVFRVEWLTGPADVLTTLASDPRIGNVQPNGNSAVFQIADDEHVAAEVLGALVNGGAQVVAFHEIKQTVEELYLKVSHHEVM